MINELFRTYKKIILLVVLLGCALFFCFFSCRRTRNVDESITSWEQKSYDDGGYYYSFATNDLTGTVTFGIKGYTVKDKNIPVSVEITSSEEDFSGLIKITVPGSNTGGIAYQSAVYCEKNLPASVTFSIPQLGNASYFCFEILDQYENTLLSRMEIPAYSEWMDTEYDGLTQLCIGVLSDQYESLSYMDGLIVDTDQETVKLRLIQLKEDCFPTNQEEMSMLDGLLIDDFTVSALSKKQISVLMNWVKDGANLIIASGEHGQKNLAGLKKKIAASPGQVETERLYFHNLSDFSGELSLYMNQLKFREDAGWKMVSWSDPASYYERSYGDGLIQLLRFSFTDESILQWNRRDDMTASLMGRLFDTAMQNSIDEENSLWSMEMALYDFNHSQMPNAFYYGIFFLIYLCTLTAVAYFILSMIKKREYIWGVVPILSFLFTACIILRSRGNSAQTETSLSAIRVVDDACEKNDIYFLYQNAEGESMELSLIPAVDQIIPMDFEYEQELKDYSLLSTIQEEYTISNTIKGYNIDFSETTPGTMRMLQMSENKSMNYGEKTEVFQNVDLTGSHTSFSGSVKNVSKDDFDKVILIRANEYWTTEDVKAGDSFTISDQEVVCWSQNDEEYSLSSEEDDPLIQDISDYLLYHYMEYNSDLGDVLVIGINLQDDFDLLREGQELGDEVSVYINHISIPEPESMECQTDINLSCLKDGQSYAELQAEILEESNLEVEYQFDSNKILWAMARNHDRYQGHIYAYNYDTKQKEEILSSQDDIMYCEELEPYISEMNVMKISYEQSEDTEEYNLPILSVWLKKTIS